jgi:putative ABC transport system ATP-binding protein
MMDPGLTARAPHIRLQHVGKTYGASSRPFIALHDVCLSIEAGEFVAVTGKSGSGKSTLLNMLSGIDRPTSGEIHIGGTTVHDLKENRMSVWRGRNVGIVFQFFQLLPTLTSLENVLLPMDFINSRPRPERIPRALELLERMGVADQADKFPSTLSGGQQQRVAIARALANNPPLLVADEPTGNLDSKTSAEVISLFTGLSQEGKTVVMVTHDPDSARTAERTIHLADGSIDSGDGGSHA